MDSIKAKVEANENDALVVALLPNRTSAGWFHDNVYFDAEIRFMRKRLNFSGSNSATFGSMIVIWSKDISAPRVLTCDRLGHVFRNTQQAVLEEVFANV